MLCDQEVPGYIEDEGVELVGVESQRVVVVKPINLYVSEAHFVVGKNSVRVDRVFAYSRDRV